MNKSNLQRAMLHGAHQYAQADRSDPFAFNRAMTHMSNGVSGVRREVVDGRVVYEDAFYRATQVQETRVLPGGRVFSDGSNKFNVTVFRDVQRP